MQKKIEGLNMWISPMDNLSHYDSGAGKIYLLQKDRIIMT